VIFLLLVFTCEKPLLLGFVC